MSLFSTCLHNYALSVHLCLTISRARFNPSHCIPLQTGSCKSCPDGLESPEGSEAITDCVSYLGGCATSSDCDTSSVVRLALPQPVAATTYTVCGRVEIVEASAPHYDPVNQDWGTVCKLNHAANAETWDDKDATVRLPL